MYCTRARSARDPETHDLNMQLQYIVAMDETNYSPSTPVAYTTILTTDLVLVHEAYH